MSALDNLDMQRICRLCCAIKFRMRLLFEKRQEYPVSLRQMIYALAQIEVDPNDGMPQKVCSLCITGLLKMYQTVQHYRANDEMLRTHLNRPKPDEIKDVVEVEMCVKQEIVEEDCQELDLHKSESIGGTDGKQIAAASATASVVADDNSGMMRIKDEPLDINDEESYQEMLEQNCPELDPLKMESIDETVENQIGAASDDDHSHGDDDRDHGDDDRDHGDDDHGHDDHDNDDDLDEDDNDWIGIKDEPVDVLDEDDSSPTAVEPTPKPKRGRPCTKVEDPNRPKLHDYKCYICKSESYGSDVGLLTHLNSSHKDLLPYTCSECVMETVVLNTLLTLNGHLRQHLNPVKCPYCDKRYLTPYKVDLHVQRQHPAKVAHSGQRAMKCDQCDEEHSSKVSLMQHVKLAHTASSTVSCAACGEEFTERTKLRFHIQKHHGQTSKLFECTICQKKLTTLKILQSHLKTFHSNSNQEFKCSHCPKSYSTLFSKRAHEKNHTRDPSYKAKQNWTQYYSPLVGQEGRKNKTCKCHICGKITRKIYQHLQGVHFPVAFTCKICHHSFVRKERYRDHLKMKHPDLSGCRTKTGTKGEQDDDDEPVDAQFGDSDS